MKRIYFYAIIAVLIAVGIVVTSIFTILTKEPFVNIRINGLARSYHAGDVISFSSVIEGYGNPCGQIGARIKPSTNASAGNLTLGNWSQVPNCVSDPSSIEFTQKFPVNGGCFSTTVNQTGTYKLEIVFEQLPSHQNTITEQEFVVT